MEIGCIVVEHTPIREITAIGQNPTEAENIPKDNGRHPEEVSIGYKVDGDNFLRKYSKKTQQKWQFRQLIQQQMKSLHLLMK
jgi:hypothetical protein